MGDLLKNNVKEIRLKANLTQETLAELCDVSRQTIISIEHGVYQPTIALALKLANALDTKVENLFKLK